MIVRTLGLEALLQLMSKDRPPGDEMTWLLYGPTDERAVEGEEDEANPMRWAAE